ncbi:unnamed protein product [Clonostachys rosea f. rosea IK726]|uniref:Uncharacterized protein n=2 Tax=Bionectria ochroleuca TaxID=29856 RepID=A0ACA9THR6_BIOOC|nr:unnamed protein product [Clonostachys rosea f. rosea IK726]
MKASLFLAATGAAVSMAQPLSKRAIITELVIETAMVTETVTVSCLAGQSVKPTTVDQPAPTTIIIKPSSSSTSVAPVIPSTTSVVVPVITTTSSSIVAPPPTTTSVSSAPVPTTTSTSTSAPAPTTTSTSVAQPTTSTSSSPPATPTGYEETMLYHHNIHRANHSVVAMEWDATLAQYAHNSASNCVWEHDMNQGDGNYGQNLASWGSTGDIDDLQISTGAAAVTEQWYNGEEPLYSSFYGLADPPMTDFHLWGHFTQLVWKDSNRVGCATVKCGAGTVLAYQGWYTICNYGSPGNYAGEYGKNVMSPLKQDTIKVTIDE